MPIVDRDVDWPGFGLIIERVDKMEGTSGAKRRRRGEGSGGVGGLGVESGSARDKTIMVFS